MSTHTVPSTTPDPSDPARVVITIDREPGTLALASSLLEELGEG